MRILAADIGGTAIKVGEVTDSGELVSFSEHPSESKQGRPGSDGAPSPYSGRIQRL